MEVIVQNQTSSGYYVTLVDIYKSHDTLNGSLVIGQTVHLKFPRSKSKFNLKFAHCRCVRLNPRQRYVAFGYKSNITDDASGGGESLHVYQATHVRNETKEDMTRLLRRIISHECKDPSEHAPSITPGLEPLTPDKVGKVVISKGGKKVDVSKHTSKDKKDHNQLKVGGEPVPEIS